MIRGTVFVFVPVIVIMMRLPVKFPLKKTWVNEILMLPLTCKINLVSLSDKKRQPHISRLPTKQLARDVL